MTPMNVQSLPLHRPIILKKDCSLRQAALAMKRNQVGSVLVTDGKGVLRGIFTDRDLALALALKNMPVSDTLAHITPHALLYVNETATLRDVIDLMKSFAIRRVPVVQERANGKQKCLGIITLDDLIKERLIESDDEISILKSQLITPKKKVGRSRMSHIFHNQGRREHSMHTFIKHVETQTGLNKTQARLLTADVLTFILRRVGVKAGKNLLSQLPQELQAHLQAEISPPDRTLSGKLLIEHLQDRFAMDPEGAQQALQDFWKSLQTTVSQGELQSLSRELPRDITRILISRQSA